MVNGPEVRGSYVRQRQFDGLPALVYLLFKTIGRNRHLS